MLSKIYANKLIQHLLEGEGNKPQNQGDHMNTTSEMVVFIRLQICDVQ